VHIHRRRDEGGFTERIGAPIEPITAVHYEGDHDERESDAQ
jgi:hypothetical protein